MFIFLYLPEVLHEYLYILFLVMIFIIILILNIKYKVTLSKKEKILCFYPLISFQLYYLSYGGIPGKYGKYYPSLGVEFFFWIAFSIASPFLLILIFEIVRFLVAKSRRV